MSLPALFMTLESELDNVSHHIKEFVRGKPQITSSTHFSFQEECYLEGLISRAWQAWGSFCRECIIESCTGTVNLSGVAITALPSAGSEGHVSWAAIKAKSATNTPPYWGGVNGQLWKEPTWGDADILDRILLRLTPNNYGQFRAAMSAYHQSIKSIQIIRNGSAHHNHQTMAQVMSLVSSYIVFPISHPIHAMFWSEPSTGDFLATFALYEMKAAALGAIT